MKKVIVTAISFLFAAMLFADDAPVRKTRTLVVKDGKVITDTLHGPWEGALLGGPRAFIGVSLVNMSPELREHFGAPKDSGVMVESVQADSPADKAGVKIGDIILSADGKDVKWSGDLRDAMRDKKDGDNVRLEVLRGRSRQTLVTTVKEREVPRLIQLDELPGMFDTSEWRARIERAGGDCGDLQTRIKELENRLKDLEKKLQK
ncbi:MAG TPA: PDZ domain-containing protein [Thermoanaerobaculia bacterium]|jgi:predicted metalloprotease with PDZ domain|nr:PDZ domain-containing protein [Thermoanaerobaculia bacterium]